MRLGSLQLSKYVDESGDNKSEPGDSPRVICCDSKIQFHETIEPY